MVHCGPWVKRWPYQTRPGSFEEIGHRLTDCTPKSRRQSYRDKFGRPVQFGRCPPAGWCAASRVNLVALALALLCTSKLALDERALARVLDLYLACCAACRRSAKRQDGGRRRAGNYRKSSPLLLIRDPIRRVTFGPTVSAIPPISGCARILPWTNDYPRYPDIACIADLARAGWPKSTWQPRSRCTARWR